MKKIKVILSVLIAFIIVMPLAACNMNGISALADKTKYGIVDIKCGTNIGSGFIVAAPIEGEGCKIITNFHVISDNLSAAPIQVRFFGQSYFSSAALRGYNQDYDVALITVAENVPQNIYAFAFGTDPKLGKEVLSLGYAEGLLTAYKGSVSIEKKAVVTNLKSRYVFEVNAPAPAGTSGGACIDSKGKIVGLNAYNYTVEGLLGGLSYKIPASIVSALYNRIVQSESLIAVPALGFVIHPDGNIAVTCLGNTFEVKDEYETLLITDSSNLAYPTGSTISMINGKEANIFTLLSELIALGDKTQIEFKDIIPEENA